MWQAILGVFGISLLVIIGGIVGLCYEKPEYWIPLLSMGVLGKTVGVALGKIAERLDRLGKPAVEQK
jgi:hypothetical protein